MDSAQKGERQLLAMLLALTFVTGMIDAASFLAMGRVFTANMTGNIVFLGFAIAGAPGLSIGRSLTALAAALAGGMLARRMHGWFGTGGQRVWLASAWSAESALLMASAAIAWAHPKADAASAAICAVIVLTALAMGVRNGTMRRLAVPDMTTTVLTLTVAALAFDFSFSKDGNLRWRRRVASVAAMLLGASAGTLLLHFALAAALAASAVVTLLCVLTQIVAGER
ncbi:MAG: YoaK family protein [Terracidiphilus sp.]|nr:YoaK family protein [Terracidiphilus sp.]